MEIIPYINSMLLYYAVLDYVGTNKYVKKTKKIVAALITYTNYRCSLYFKALHTVLL